MQHIDEQKEGEKQKTQLATEETMVGWWNGKYCAFVCFSSLSFFLYVCASFCSFGMVPHKQTITTKRNPNFCS